MIYVNGGPPSDEFTNELDRTIKEYKQTKENRSIYMTYAQELLYAEAQGVSKGVLKNALTSVRNIIKKKKMSPAEAIDLLGYDEELSAKLMPLLN